MSSYGENGFRRMCIYYRLYSISFSNGMPSTWIFGISSCWTILFFFLFLIHFFLKKLQSLSHCELITDEGIRHLSTSTCASEHLAVLELDNCPLITDASLDHLINCHNLQRIMLYDCQLITRNGIKRLRVSKMLLYFWFAYWIIHYKFD